MGRLVALLVLVSGCSFEIPPLDPLAADAGQLPPGALIVAPARGPSAIAVDGKLSEWTFVSLLSLSHASVTGGAADGTWPGGSIADDNTLSAEVWALWDADALYVAVAVTDHNLQARPGGGAAGDGDTVELFLDGDASHGATYDADDRHVFLEWSAGALAPPSDACGASACAGGSWATAAKGDRSDGWDLEARIPWSNLGGAAAKGRRIGFDLQIDDDDAGTARERDLLWFIDPTHSDGRPDLHPSAFGYLELGAPL